MIRPARSDDAQALADVWNPWIRNTAVTFNSIEKTAADITAMMAARAAGGHGFFVAADQSLLGFASYTQFRGGIGYAHAMEHTVVLAPEARGRGIGRALLSRVEAHARAAGAHVMIAGVSGENAEGRAFHLALGYREIATLCEVGYKFGRRMDIVLMQKFLS